jgi:GNAT superfamily N-acetyltransferase
MPIDVSIATPGKEDFDEVFLLLKQLWPIKRFKKEKLKTIFIQGLHDPRYAFLVAKHDGKVVGFASLRVKRSFWDEGVSGYIDELVVDKRYRGRGIGKRLLEDIIKIARKMSCKRVELDSASYRKRAHSFYRSQGFGNWSLLFSKDI